MLKLENVKSSNVSAIGYDENKKELYIKYNTNAVYKYLNVPKFIFDNMKAAKSIGKYVTEYVKCAGYSYEKVESLED